MQFSSMARSSAVALPAPISAELLRHDHCHRYHCTLTLTPPPTRTPPLPPTTITPAIQRRHISTTNYRQSTTRLFPSDVLRLMDCLQLPVEADLYASLLQECTRAMDPVQGTLVHDHLRRGGARALTGRDVLLVANRLILMYCGCGLQDSARKVFDSMPVRDLVTWVVMIVGFVDCGNHVDALKVFAEMLQTGWDNEDSCCFLQWMSGVVGIAAVLRSCAALGKLAFGQCVHGLILKAGGLVDGCRMGRLLLRFYDAVGCVDSARRVFQFWDLRDPASCGVMMEMYHRHGMCCQALKLFMDAGRNGKRRGGLTLSIALRACGRMGDDEAWNGMQLHAVAIKIGIDSDPSVEMDLMQMYGRLNLLREARKMFDQIGSGKDTMCWSIMLNLYTKRRCCKEAVKILYEMKAAGVEPDETMLNEARLVCGSR